VRRKASVTMHALLLVKDRGKANKNKGKRTGGKSKNTPTTSCSVLIDKGGGEDDRLQGRRSIPCG